MRSPFAPIPMPESGMEAFLKGMHGAQQVFDSLAANRLNAQKLAQQQQLLPYMLQEYKDVHAKLPYELKHLAAQTGASGAAAQASQAMATLHRQQAEQAQREGLLDQMIYERMQKHGGGGPGNQAQIYAPQEPAANQAMHEEEEELVGNQPGEKRAGMPPGLQQMQIPGQQQPQAPQMQMPGQQQGEQPIQQGQMPQQQNIPSQYGEFGNEQIIKPANPGMEFMDEMAQQGMKTKRFEPKITIKPVGPYEEVHYPSGKITRRKTQQTEAEKAKELGITKAEVKRAEDYAGAAEQSVHVANLVNRAKELLIKNPKLTHALSGWKLYLPGNEDYAELDTIFGELQALTAKEANPRGGIQTINWAKLVKPSTGTSGDTNLGRLKVFEDKIKEKFPHYKNYYKKITGKDLEFDMPKFIERPAAKKTPPIQAAPAKAKEEVKYIKGKKFIKRDGEWHHA
jgi:hypothetical protein